MVLANGYRFPCPLKSYIDGMKIVCAIRPHHLRISNTGVAAEIVLVEMTGEGQEILVRVGDREMIVVSHEKLDVSPAMRYCWKPSSPWSSCLRRKVGRA